MLNREVAKRLKKDPDFQEFAEYVTEIVEKLNNVENFDDEYSDVEIGEMVRGSAKAISILRSVLSPVIDFQEKKKASEEDVRKAREKFGLE